MENRDADGPSTKGLSERIWNGMPRENLATRVANAIREQVHSGKLVRGVQLRGEVEFARELGVSRQTLREATRLLTREGLLTIRHGVGTFVAESPGYLSSQLDTMQSMSSLIRKHGGTHHGGTTAARSHVSFPWRRAVRQKAIDVTGRARRLAKDGRHGISMLPIVDRFEKAHSSVESGVCSTTGELHDRSWSNTSAGQADGIDEL